MFSGLTTTEIIMLFVALLVSVVLHELMHGVAAYWLGDDTAASAGRLTLNPLASVDPLTTVILPFILIVTAGVPFFAAKPVPFNPDRVRGGEYGAALVGLAGPLTNFALAVVGALVFRVSAGTVQDAAYIFTIVNVGLAVFNLIPFPPLDGSRLLYAFAPEPIQRAMAAIEQMGFIVVLIFILVIFQFIAPVISNIDNSITTFLLG